jgi:hypothetical protein
MHSEIEAFGGDGPHEVRFRTAAGTDTTWVKRDLWFDRTGGESWLVWAQERSWTGDELPTDHDPEALGSIVVAHPAVMAFLDQLGALLVNPARFRHEPTFAEAPTPPPSPDMDLSSEG